MSPHPYNLEPVEPVIQFEQAKYRFAEPVDALAGIDSRPDLLKMDGYKFENLICQLFEAMGLEVHVTQSSRDEGIDAVAFAPLTADWGRRSPCSASRGRPEAGDGNCAISAGSRASRTWKVMTQRDEEAGLTALPGPGAGLTAAMAACR